MALRITRASDPLTVDQLVVCIYAPPGLGKSTLGFSAHRPIMLDFDRGAHRAANRKDSVQVTDWQDVTEITPADLADFDTVVIDTAGRALDLLSADIIRRNPKMGKGGALAAEPGMKQQNYIAQPVACGTDCYNGAITGDVAATLGTPGSSLNASGPTVMQAVAFHPTQDPISFGAQMSYPQVDIGVNQTLQAKNPMAVAQNMAVRRLTPVECERLMAMPDNYTRIPWRGKPAEGCPDGPRYKALGNSIAVNCLEWIGERLERMT